MENAALAAPASSRHITAIFNPAAGRNRRQRLDETVNLLRNAGCSVSVHVTERPGHAEEIARGAKPGDVVSSRPPAATAPSTRW